MSDTVTAGHGTVRQDRIPSSLLCALTIWPNTAGGGYRRSETYSVSGVTDLRSADIGGADSMAGCLRWMAFHPRTAAEMLSPTALHTKGRRRWSQSDANDRSV